MTRLWHWVLALAVTLCWAFGEFMSFTLIQWHFYLGYLIIGLIVFRLAYGLVGPDPIRLKQLFPKPRELFSYLGRLFKRVPSGTAGHNPLGALSVLLMLVALLVQTGSGLFLESDDFFEAAPLSSLVPSWVVGRLTEVHEISAKVILVLVAVHVSAIVFYRIWKRENLILPMITGWKWVKKQSNHD